MASNDGTLAFCSAAPTGMLGAIGVVGEVGIKVSSKLLHRTAAADPPAAPLPALTLKPVLTEMPAGSSRERFGTRPYRTAAMEGQEQEL